jgi:hypothetical protein
MYTCYPLTITSISSIQLSQIKQTFLHLEQVPLAERTGYRHSHQEDFLGNSSPVIQTAVGGTDCITNNESQTTDSNIRQTPRRCSSNAHLPFSARTSAR